MPTGVFERIEKPDGVDTAWFALSTKRISRSPIAPTPAVGLVTEIAPVPAWITELLNIKVGAYISPSSQ